MKTNIAELTKKAKSAPVNTVIRGKWTHFFPILKILKKEKGYSNYSAVKWLVSQGEVEPKDFAAIYQTFLRSIDSK